jgi:aspartate kinase
VVVLKFGGKSLGSRAKVEHICEQIMLRAKSEQMVVVVSAFGNTTNNLLQIAEGYGADARETDVVLACGEMQASALVAGKLNSMGAKAKSFAGFQLPIMVGGKHGECNICSVETSKLTEWLNAGGIAVVAGFQGINNDGEICTIGRGGSDTTAVAIGKALGCPVEIYSDYDGIYFGDPRRLNYKRAIKIDYSTLEKLAKSGAKVMSVAGAEIAKKYQVPLVLKGKIGESTGTVVTGKIEPFVGINVTENLCKVSIFASLGANLQKSACFILKNIKYCSFFAKNDQIDVIIDKKDAKMLEFRLAKLNKLLKK